MKIIDFDQSSDSWLEWRSNGIGASDVGVIMGVDPYKNKRRLWREKCGFVESAGKGPGIRHGKTTEPRARYEFNLQRECNAKPICVEDDQVSWARASLDGWDKEKEILVEIKCPVSPEKISNILDTRDIPLNWMYQMQWQLGIVRPSSEKAWYAMWDFRDESIHSWEIVYDHHVFGEIFQKAEEFWGLVRKGICP